MSACAPTSAANSSLVTAAQSRINALWSPSVAPWQVVRDTLLALLVAYGSVRVAAAIRKKGWKKALVGGALSVVPKSVIKAETDKSIKKLQHMVSAQQNSQQHKHANTKRAAEANMVNQDAASEKILTSIPSKGEDAGALLARLRKWQASEGKHWRDGQVSGGIYHGGDELVDFLTQVYGMFSLSNPLHVEVFPFVRKMECEVVRMTVSLFHGDDACCGTMTSGGTESILMAMKSYRDEARTRGIEHAEILCGVSAHAAFDKAAHYFNMTVVHVPVDPVTMRVDVAAAKKAITANTVVIVASAPGFPHGVVDPVTELAALAAERGIGCHVDSCLGGYLLPFAVKLGYDIPPFDFAVKGVTSISADTHKYGYAPKGASVIMYRNNSLRSFQYFVAADWTGGIYASPSMPGSRPGGLIAATWAALVRMGEEGYLACAKEIMSTAKEIEAGIRATPGLRVLGKPDMSVVSFAADESTPVRGQQINIYKVAESMGAKRTNPDGSTKYSWALNILQKPASVHICCTYMHRGRAAEFIRDVRAAVDQVADNPDMFKNGSAAIYGLAESLPEGPLEEVTRGFIDTLYMQ